MGAIAESIVAFTQPLLDETDGSLEQVNKAFAIGQMCWNLAITPAHERDEMIAMLRLSLEMEDEEFESFCNTVVQPMIQRPIDMFPGLHGRSPRH